LVELEKQFQKGTLDLDKLSPLDTEIWLHYKGLNISPKKFKKESLTPKAKDLYIFFRGTARTGEWLKNLKIRQRAVKTKTEIDLDDIKIHSGFAQIGEKVFSEIMKYTKITNYRNIYIGGHSLGGALTGLISLLLYASIPLGENKPGIYAHTFGKPRVGNEAFANFINEKLLDDHFLRFEHHADIITKVPLEDQRAILHSKRWDYKHEGKAISFEKDYGTVAWNHVLDAYIISLQEEISKK
jgi:hypothetical protein